MSRIVHVAVGVIVGSDGAILIAKRPDKTHQGGLWEFPGGKVESGESLFEALQRELKEELAIDITATTPLIKIRHDYGDKIVLLDVHKVNHFSGDPKGNEGQPVAWVLPENLHDYEFPAANRPIITAINLPSRLLITGTFSDLTDFDRRLKRALDNGIKLVQLRIKDRDFESVYVEAAVKLCEQYSAQLLINTDFVSYTEMTSIEHKLGLYLNSKNLMACAHRPVSADILLGASCHNLVEIEHAQKMGVDFICLSPVKETQSHPEQTQMGWPAFEQLVMNATVPVYALGGMKEVDLSMALDAGAQGVAAISEWWI